MIHHRDGDPHNNDRSNLMGKPIPWTIEDTEEMARLAAVDPSGILGRAIARACDADRRTIATKEAHGAR